ncbi:MAG: suppressor of fused domain protein [Anaerolineales bacterium]|jgi:hypothetical protein
MSENDLPPKNRSNGRRTSLSEAPHRTPVDLEMLNRIEAHIKEHIPGEGTVSHEIITSQVHIDVHIRMPTPYRQFITLVTCGMSSRPMNAPYDFQKFKFAELLICLPPDWDLSEGVFNDEQKYWPIKCLRNLALRPHANDSWLWTDHIVPNGEPPKPYASDTKLCGALISKPTLFRQDFVFLRLDDNRIVHFLSVVPLYKEEMMVMRRRGQEALREMLDAARVNELMNIHRRNTVKFLGLF